MTEIRSYRRVFDLERRIYSVDRVRLNPGGVPVRGVVYFLLISCGCVLATGLPVAGALAGWLPWYLRDIALPGVAATVLSSIHVEGRVFHLAAGALLRQRLGPRRLAGMRPGEPLGARWYPPALLALSDGSDARMRRARYRGPGAVLVCVEHERAGRACERGSSATARRGLRAAVTLRERADARALERGVVISLAPGVRLLVRARRRRSA